MDTYEVIFTNLANQDFYYILDYIAHDNPHIALQFINELQKRTKNTLSTAPFAGTVYKDEIRFFTFDNSIVIYEPNTAQKQVTVYMISEAHRQWQFIIDERIHNQE